VASPLPAVVDAADPPSTGTTEYVARLASGSKNLNGNDDAKDNREETANSVEVDL